MRLGANSLREGLGRDYSKGGALIRINLRVAGHLAALEILSHALPIKGNRQHLGVLLKTCHHGVYHGNEIGGRGIFRHVVIIPGLLPLLAVSDDGGKSKPGADLGPSGFTRLDPVGGAGFGSLVAAGGNAALPQHQDEK